MSDQNLEQLIATFAENVVAQNEATMRGDARTGNKHAKKLLAAFDALSEGGYEGLEALTVLLKHPRPDVRSSAPCFLLRHRTRETLAVLKEVAKKRGLAGLGASECLKRWQEGTWQLDLPAAKMRCEFSHKNLIGPADVGEVLGVEEIEAAADPDARGLQT